MVQADIPINKISVILFELEMKGVIRVLAGGVYQLLK
jgi:DNA processing protein